MVQVIPGKYLLHTRKRIGFPPAPAYTNWENHHFISMWSPPDMGTNCILLLQDSKPSYKHTESWLHDWRPKEEAQVMFLHQSGCKHRRGNCPVQQCFLSTSLPSCSNSTCRENHSKKIKHGFLGPQSSCSFSFCEHIEDQAFHNFLLIISVVCFWMAGREAAFFSSYHIWGICSPCAIKLLSSPNYLSFLHFYFTCFVELKFLRGAWHCDCSTHQRLQDATLKYSKVVILLSDHSQPCYHNKRHVEMLINNIDYDPDA